MKKKFIFGIVAFVLAIACSQKKENVTIPDNVLNKEKFSDLICDLTLAETAANINIKKSDGQKFDSIYAFNPLIENNVSRSDFDTTLYFYCHHPNLFKEVYELCFEKLSKMQDSRKKDKKPLKDSVK